MTDEGIKEGAYIGPDGDAYIVWKVAEGRDTPERLVFYTYQPRGQEEGKPLYLKVGEFLSAIQGYRHQDEILAEAGNIFPAAPEDGFDPLGR